MDTRYQDFIRQVKGRNDAGLCLRDGCNGPPEVVCDVTLYIDLAGRLRFPGGMCRVHAAQSKARFEAAEKAGLT